MLYHLFEEKEELIVVSNISFPALHQGILCDNNPTKKLYILLRDNKINTM